MMNTCRDFNTKQKENEMKLNLSTNFNNKLGKILISHNKEIFFSRKAICFEINVQLVKFAE